MTVLVSTVGLYILSAVFAPTSVTAGPQLSMLAFASVLAIVGLGQMLVVQQGGIDLSVPGAVSLAVVIASHQPNGDDSKLLGAVVMAYGFSLLSGFSKRSTGWSFEAKPDHCNSRHQRTLVRSGARHFRWDP